MTPDQLREAVARAMCEADLNLPHAAPDFYVYASAAIAIVVEEMARVAEGPVYRTSGTGEVAIRGTDQGNWSVPMPASGYKGSDYGTGRYDAAAAIRAYGRKDEATSSAAPSRLGA